MQELPPAQTSPSPQVLLYRTRAAAQSSEVGDPEVPMVPVLAEAEPIDRARAAVATPPASSSRFDTFIPGNPCNLQQGF